MKRKRISLQMCVYSTGDTPTVSKKEQEELEHLHRLKKIDEISRREKSEVHTTVVVKKKWNPAIHRYAWMNGWKVKITSQDDFERFSGYVKITKD